MDIRYIEAFYEVVTQKNFAKAAAKLNIAPSAVTRQIKLLEESTKLPLINRTTKELSLTKDGQKLFNAVERFYTDLSNQGYRQKNNVLKIGAMEGILQDHLLPLIAKFQKLHKVTIDIEVDSPNPLVSSQERGDLDILFISNANESIITKSFEVLPYFEERICLVSKTPVALRDIHKHRWVVYETNTWITRYTSKSPLGLIRVNHMPALIDLVKMGHGIAMIPEHCVGKKSGLSITPVKKYGKQQVSMVVRPKHQRTFLVQEFISFLQ